ncbi:MAG: SPFH domain-containing protein, partial [Ruminococcus sp.]|nr:SPFH domain-containing protein [Ruminococcus sp.]
MGLKQLAKKVIQAGMDTGLGQAAINAGSDMLADQWKEYFYCDAIPVDVLVVKGQKRIGKKSQNTKGSDNLISNGSVIAVNSGQCMIIVDQGQVVEVCAETGEYVYDTSLEPSLFAGDFLGDFKKNVMDFIKATGRRITFGGDTARDQRIYFINTKEILDNKFGTP